ncbi:hypothetical protein Vadar_024210 [Vaccinium darrowii]|uniref:Uncharacterized protein n=1 Tax=Vaccinium darrowii TaxID=229202 RepID=A0ACB7XJU1_9ERIC|nr:hypothetical protein Vadar_024210 [Vaccinium darrowii]
MDQRENQPHSLGICSRLRNSLRKKVTEISLKLTIFGCLFSRGLAICCRLFDFVVQSLASQAMKTVTLGPAQGVPTQGQTSQARFKPEQASTGLGGSASLPSLSLNCNDFLKVGKELHPVQDEDRTKVVAPESEIEVKGPPKKMVSINDRAKVVIYESKKKKKKKTTDKSPSLEREKEEDTKPLKSILKAGSNLK